MVLWQFYLFIELTQAKLAIIHNIPFSFTLLLLTCQIVQSSGYFISFYCHFLLFHSFFFSRERFLYPFSIFSRANRFAEILFEFFILIHFSLTYFNLIFPFDLILFRLNVTFTLHSLQNTSFFIITRRHILSSCLFLLGFTLELTQSILFLFLSHLEWT